ncbi:Rhodopsin domain-containing protein [Madurella fahalii]|uniref:Rhodopsin domain-containing protein n=1 Tax=Madurella fahalii TaxID=1157608 RepID=A0ABQ0GIZ7_9PEZI
MPSPRGLTRQLGRSTQAGVDNLGPYLLHVVWSLVALSGLFLGLRAYCKLRRRRPLWWDDHFLTASWITLVISVVLQSVGVHYGLGKPYADQYEQGTISTVAQYSYIAGFFSILATCWSKTSFAISLLRIATGREMRWFIWFIIITVNLMLGSNGAIQWVQCWPIGKLWNWEMEGSCLPPNTIQVYNAFIASFSGLMDIILALLPWKIIWDLTINKKEKLGVLVAMSTGILAGIMSFLKIKTLYVIGNSNATTVDLFIFGTAEPATAIMAASIPVLRALIRREPGQKPTAFIGMDNHRIRTQPSPELSLLDGERMHVKKSMEQA